MKDISILGIDLAKTICHIVGLYKNGKKILSTRLHRKDFEREVENQVPKTAILVMEACGTCHYWSNRFIALGYQVKLLKPIDVKAFARGRQKMTLTML